MQRNTWFQKYVLPYGRPWDNTPKTNDCGKSHGDGIVTSITDSWEGSAVRSGLNTDSHHVWQVEDPFYSGGCRNTITCVCWCWKCIFKKIKSKSEWKKCQYNNSIKYCSVLFVFTSSVHQLREVTSVNLKKAMGLPFTKENSFVFSRLCFSFFPFPLRLNLDISLLVRSLNQDKQNLVNMLVLLMIKAKTIKQSYASINTCQGLCGCSNCCPSHQLWPANEP